MCVGGFLKEIYFFSPCTFEGRLIGFLIKMFNKAYRKSGWMETLINSVNKSLSMTSSEIATHLYHLLEFQAVKVDPMIET